MKQIYNIYPIFILTILFLSTRGFADRAQEFQERWKNSQFRQAVGDLSALSEDDLVKIRRSVAYENTDLKPKILRDISKYKGSYLLVGGERNSSNTTPPNKANGLGAQTDAEYADEELAKINKDRNYLPKFNPITAEKVHNREDYIKILEQIKKQTMENSYKYYVVNIVESVEPDLLGSIMVKSHMASIPDNRFDTVHFEAVDCPVFLSENTWEIVKRITKKEGKIIINTAPACARLIPLTPMDAGLKKQIEEQIIPDYKSFVSGEKKFEITIINK